MDLTEQRKFWRREEQDLTERYSAAFNRMLDAQAAVTRQFYPHGSGAPTRESMAAANQARAEFKAIQREWDRIGEEFNSGERS